MMIRAHIMLWMTAIIWGLSFVAQSSVTSLLEPNSFNAARFVFATLSLTLLLFIFPTKQCYQRRELIKKGVLLGIVLFTGFSFQQAGLDYVSAGDAGFVSSTYIVIVPLIGFMMGQKVTKSTWLGVLIATFGLYFLSVSKNFNIKHGDIIELIGAFFWACHVILISKLAKQFPPIPLATAQFATAALLASIAAYSFEQPKLSHYTQEWAPILYSSVIALGIASIFQILGQKQVSASISALILSTAAIFSLLGDWLIVENALSTRAYIGCGFILAGLIITLIPCKSTTNSKATTDN